MLVINKRFAAKTLTWRLLAIIITSTGVLIVTGSLVVAGAVGLIDTAVKLVAYYFHEYFWERSDWGRKEDNVEMDEENDLALLEVLGRAPKRADRGKYVWFCSRCGIELGASPGTCKRCGYTTASYKIECYRPEGKLGLDYRHNSQGVKNTDVSGEEKGVN